MNADAFYGQIALSRAQGLRRCVSLSAIAFRQPLESRIPEPRFSCFLRVFEKSTAAWETGIKIAP